MAKTTQTAAVPRPMGPPRGPGHGPVPIERAKNAQGAMRRLWGYLRQQRAMLAVIFFLVLLSTALNLVGPYLTGRAIDQFILKHDLPGLARLVLLMLAVYAAMTLTNWLQAFWMATIAQRTVRLLRNTLFSKYQTLSLRYFDSHSHGELMSRLTNDVENVSATLSDSVIRLFSGLLSLLGVTVMMLMLSWRLAIVTLVTIPLMVFLTKRVSAYTRLGFRKQQAALGALNGNVEENITGARVIKAFCGEARATQQFDKLNSELRASAIQAQSFSLILGPMMNLINNIGNAVVVGAGGWMALEGWVTVGTIAAFINYAQQLGRPLNELANLINTIQAALAGAERVFEVLDESPELTDAPDAQPLPDLHGEVEFDAVTFGYVPEVPVLHDVSLHAQPGQTIAFVGPTGAGKTTIINLLLRFYDIQAGAIRLDGHDIRAVRKVDLRRRVGIVLQDTYLFSDTVMENIRYGRLDASEAEVVAAAKLANADDFIRHLPHGYQTRLTERGNNLSQGQRQLLAIARALLADPAILILDEATSSVDTRTEANIQQALTRLMAGRTCFLIAHRLKTVRDADAILVIQGGRVIERGSHTQLLAQRGFYYNLYTSQFKGQIAEV